MSSSSSSPAASALAAAGSAPAGATASPAGAAIDHRLALKVMRLTRPTVATPLVCPVDRHPSASLSPHLLKESLHDALVADANALKGKEEIAIGNTLVLPQSFGNIYLGETFSSYVSLHNDSTEICTKVSLRCDLQTGTQRIALYPGDQPGVLAQFVPGAALDHVLQHEVKELGTHILVCEVTYSYPSQPAGAPRATFRKFFKFQVMKPLDVKTKFYNAESDEVFLEAQVQNVTSGPLCLEKVFLDPSQLFTVSALNSVKDDETGTEKSVFGKINCLQPQDSRQYLFCLTPKPEIQANHKLMRGVTNIGKLDIVWRTNMGDKGRLQTSQLQRMAPNYGDVRLIVEQVPSTVTVNRAFRVSAKVVNNCDRTVDLDMHLASASAPRLTWSGTTTRSLGLVEPSGTVDMLLEAVAHDTGIVVLSGIRITDSLLKRMYDFDNLCQVFATREKGLLDAIEKVSVTC